jgi:hypothetical protein
LQAAGPGSRDEQSTQNNVVPPCPTKSDTANACDQSNAATVGIGLDQPLHDSFRLIGVSAAIEEPMFQF